MSAGRRYQLVTLGCKLNQFDSAEIEGMLHRRGLAGSEGTGDTELVVVNTCTVTGRADAEARRLVRRLRRRHPGARVLVTGCYAERDPGALAGIPGVDAVVGNGSREELPEILDRWLGPPVDGPGHPGIRQLHFGHRTRAYLKVQEGCDLRCSYCVIPRVRGASRSIPPDQVEHGLAGLVMEGFREVVLTGVNTGDWGRDLDPRLDLADLLERLVRLPGLGRIRLNSLEPRTVSDRILALMGDPAGKIAPHLQVPLQSGSDRILRAMRRNYRTADYARVVERLRRAVPHVGIGADVIVGFPGEGETQFAETRTFIDRVGLDYLHVFSWSPRQGTEAARLPGRVDQVEVRRRAGLLRTQAARQGLAFRRRFLGRTLEAVTLEARRDDGRLRALTGNFIEVSLPAGTVPPNRLVPVRIVEVTPEETRAESLRAA
jgi:threonylcarbamoyladenosine tRNA methylthiotransferase MtaB